MSDRNTPATLSLPGAGRHCLPDRPPSGGREWWLRAAQAAGSGWHGLLPMWWLTLRLCPHCGLSPCDDQEPELLQPPAPAPVEPLPPHPSARPTPRATVEAIVHGVRERGAAALRDPANLARLRSCDAAALAEIDRRMAHPRGGPS